ncbi:MAG: N-acetyltransferase family protein [Methanobacterium sp.]
METHIRKIGINDISPLVKMYLSLSEVNKKYFHPFKFNKTSLILRFTFFSISNKINKLIKNTFPKLFALSFIAMDENERPVGFAYIYNLSKGSNYSFWEANDFGIFISEKYHGFGIGSKLIQEIIDASIPFGIKKIKLTVLAENKNAIHLYEKFGFKLGKYHEERELWNGKYYPDHDMVLDIKKSNFINERLK